MKQCNRCGCVWPATEDYFYKSSRSKDGWRPACKICILDSQQIYYLNHLAAEQDRKRLAYHSRKNQSQISA